VIVAVVRPSGGAHRPHLARGHYIVVAFLRKTT